MADFELQTLTRGPVSDEQRSYGERRVRHASRLAARPVLFGRLTLIEHENPSTERPAAAKASLDVGGRAVRAHVAAPTMREAIDRLEARLERRLEILAEHDQESRTATRLPEPGEWRHGDLPLHRPDYYPRSPEQREVLRHKTFEATPVTPKDAAIEMELLDHDFHLFANVDTGQDAVVYRKHNGQLGLLETAPVETLARAVEHLEATENRFVLFEDADTRQRCVLYRRYDGHYGLVTPGVPRD